MCVIGPFQHSPVYLGQKWHKTTEIIAANGRAKSAAGDFACTSIVAKQGAEETSEKSNFHAGSWGLGGAAPTPRSERAAGPRTPCIARSKLFQRSKFKSSNFEWVLNMQCFVFLSFQNNGGQITDYGFGNGRPDSETVCPTQIRVHTFLY